MAAFIAIAIAALCAFFFWFAGRYRRHLRKRKLRRSRETWAIGLYQGSSPLSLSPMVGGSSAPILQAGDVSDIRARFVADPFMIATSDACYLFFEVLNDKRNLGEIGYASSSDGLTWKYQKIVIRERHHLSYPYVFAWNGSYYLIPECHGSGGIQLYRADRFPDSWRRIATLLRGGKHHAALIDPSIIRHGESWYLFCYGKNRGLYLFVASDLTGPWREHPASPVIAGTPRFSRPGGRIIAYDGALYRFAQDETPHYGSRVWAFRILELTPERYREEQAMEHPVIDAGNLPWNRDGMHTVDPHQLQPGGSWYAYVDGFTISEHEQGKSP